ncbi:hypothetical protein THRCLA_08328 [Thraustotheca clavata]|uniref:Histone-lysine N-methyltransferase n=1 Tax=Thraustotheca clavata TaxID=74557 RepID=A0A1V9Z794_9STRA|nr:hypothetical protein THRCLA_08328 [Thraustotheca clavata]
MKRKPNKVSEAWSLLNIYTFLDASSLCAIACVSSLCAERVHELHSHRCKDLSLGVEDLLPIRVVGTEWYPINFSYRKTMQFPLQFAWDQDIKRTVDVYVAKHPLKGWALFAGEEILPKKFVGEYVGSLVRTIDMERTSKYIVSIREESSERVFRTNVDANRVGNFTRFINHSCTPNAQLDTYRRSDIVCIIPRLHIISTQLIKKDEEITIDYGIKDGVGTAPCHCGTKNCVGRLPFDVSL